MLTQENYFDDKEYISNSSLSNFISYDDRGSRILTIDDFEMFYFE
jgi:hypothetical protein